MQSKHNKQLVPFAKQLRKEMTKEERHLWYDFLKQLPLTINRQKVIGPYIADFYCAKANLIIEIDDAKNELVQCINDILRKHGLNCYLIEPMFARLYSQIKASAQNELAQAKAQMGAAEAAPTIQND